MRTWLLSAAAAILIAATLAIDGFSSPRASGATTDESAELRALRAETQRLQAAVAALEQAQRRAPAATPVSGTLPPEIVAQLGPAAAQAQAAAPAANVAAPQLTPAQERASALQYAEYLDDQLTRSTADDAAAASLKAKASEYLDGGSTLLDLQCGKELCRMKTRHADGETYRAFQNSAFNVDHIWSGPVTMVVLDEPAETGGPLVAAIYFGRGDALPSPEPTR